jgi:tetratricopeptide (TPR) repeat protein
MAAKKFGRSGQKVAKSMPAQQLLARAARLRADGYFEQALGLYQSLLRREPANQKAHHAFVEVRSGLQPLQAWFEEASRWYEAGDYVRILKQGAPFLNEFPHVAFLHNLLGMACAGLEDLSCAIMHYRAALDARPDFSEAYNNLGNVFLRQGNRALAIDQYSKALELRPDYAIAHRNLADLKTFQADDQQLESMQALLQEASEAEKIHLHFALAKAHEDLGDFDLAFAHYKEGNRLRKNELGFRIDRELNEFNMVRRSFSCPTISFSLEYLGLERQINFSARPVLIVGMPRSGTTLVESILASHTQVHAFGELLALQRVMRSHMKKINQNAVDSDAFETWHEIHRSYIEQIPCSVEAPVFTDKMPVNFKWAGYALCAMSQLKIVHIRRDPVATCWSNYKHYFSAGGNGFAYDLKDLARYYREYRLQMDFWHEQFPGRILDLSYEALTEAPEEHAKILLDFCGLPWDPECLNFQKKRQSVSTASALQVRQGIYRGSSDAWRPYEAHLQPLIKLLREDGFVS